MSAGKLRAVCIGRNRRLLSGASSFEDVPDKIGPLVRFGVPNDISWIVFVTVWPSASLLLVFM